DRCDRPSRTEDREAVCNCCDASNRSIRNDVVLLEVQTKCEFTDPVLSDVRVQASRIVMAARLANTDEAVRVCTEAGTCKEVSFFFGEVTEGREGHGVGVVDRPRELARVERRLDLAFDFRTEGLGQVVVCTELRVESRQERQTIFDDRSADVPSCVEFRVTVRGRTRERRVLSVADQAARKTVSK